MASKSAAPPKERTKSQFAAAEAASSGNVKSQGWNPPSLKQSQSWNEQDLRHHLQKRLTGLEKGREAGFTEIGGKAIKG
ncbi:hypothetical protein, variant [Coccidioides immitis RS]|uniref:Uncharacterized protein n=5 Tax=Coccidioides TaxID=5500 RepID=A0A0D8JVJ6_COCIM|nr:hypothetical protein, variant [Coccidioides immitis RS]KMM70726.1 hypothetical protein CPAG_07037 [Coccidioides posadasii RMSCC 3488]KMP05420.1 hypothetical protein CIRG_05101 [Coccidioides immitis RMSCC 2394]KMU80991.1 hypothetical protein CISG_08840 [Coccidioides immitis RMSCC 3703]KMU92163.1 hypothetical protein CIHG_10024 [Coccidioides immitis H538.4]QVM05603.1 hypothetical protein D8B26_000310 [Coccidioides posadasii str. Silveira]TPX21753.1 hypothetical protein DIZ76_015715 [Coccidio